MKFLRWTLAILLTVFSAFHVFVTYKRWGQLGPAHEAVIFPAAVAVIAAALAFWMARRAIRTTPPA